MLLNYPQFAIRQAARSPAHLLSPRVISSSDVALPRSSVIHYLDFHDDSHFPSRSINYLQNVKPAKKVPLWNITELATTTDTTIIANRFVDKEIRAWKKANISKFRLVNILEIPNADVQTHAVLNYQLLKDLYKYKSNATGSLNRFRNVYATYWAGVHKAIESDVSTEQFVRISVPSLVPSKALLDNILKQPETTYARIIRDPDLNSLIELYQYLDPVTREKGRMSAISEQDCLKITIELTFKGYSFFFKMSYLVAMCATSALESKKKLAVKQVQRMLLLIILKIQQKVYSLENDENSGTPEGDEVHNQDRSEEAPHLEDEDDLLLDEEDRLQDAIPLHLSDSPVGKASKKTLDDNEGMQEGIDSFLDEDMSELEGASDDIFIKLMAQAATPEVIVKAKDNPEEEEETSAIVADYSEEHIAKLLKPSTVEEGFDAYVQESKLSGAISTVEVRSLKKLYDKRKTLKSPYSDKTIDEHKVVTKEDLSFTQEDKKILINNDLVDDSLKTETVFNFDKAYIKKLYNKDVIACVTKLEAAGIIIKDYQVERNDSALGSYEVHKLTLKPYKGKESTVYFRLPVINEEGEFSASGVKYRMRKMRQDEIIRKVAPNRVSITTNYGKLFLGRTERKSYDPYAQLTDYIKKEYLFSSGVITSIIPGNCFDNHAVRPNIFMAMSSSFRQFSTPEYTFIFLREEVANIIKQEDIARIEAGGKYTIVGFTNKAKQVLVVDNNNLIYNYSSSETLLGDLPTLVGMDTQKLPVQFATLKVLGDTLALGVVLSYYLGLKGLLEATRTKFTIIGARQLPPKEANLITIRLSDAKVVVQADTSLKKLIFGGFAFYKETLKTITLEELGSKAVYLNLIEQRGSGLMHLRELDLLQQLLLDPISVDCLQAMGEPDEFLPLLIRACELLSDFKHPDINDPEFSRIRGYDRVPGLMYRVLMQSVRAQKLGMSRGKVELDPYAVWNAVTQDTTVKVVEDSNPVTDAKEAESVTFTGADGISKGSTPDAMRRFHKNDIGLMSEATVDSSDVGLNVYLTPYAKLENLRGKVAKDKPVQGDTAFSTSVLLAPMAEYDDPKRID